MTPSRTWVASPPTPDSEEIVNDDHSFVGNRCCVQGPVFPATASLGICERSVDMSVSDTQVGGGGPGFLSWFHLRSRNNLDERADGVAATGPRLSCVSSVPSRDVSRETFADL
jgi:hypothetical protein